MTADETTLCSVLDDVLSVTAGYLTEDVGRYFVAPGGEIAWDDCCNGQHWLRVTSVEPVISGAYTPCLIGWNVNIGLGVVRCVAVLDDRGIAPSAAALTADACTILADTSALARALLETGGVASVGCVENVTMNTWSPLGPTGGCAGGEWTARLRISPHVIG